MITLERFMLGAKEISVSGDTDVYPWEAGFYNVQTSGPALKLKVPLTTSRGFVTRGSMMAVFWNSGSNTFGVYEQDDTLIVGVGLNRAVIVSMYRDSAGLWQWTGSIWNA